MDTPIFIIGNPRSGTTLLRLMLSAHPEIVIAPECGFVQWWYDKYHLWNKRNSESINNISDFIKDLKTSRKIETWNLNFEDLSQNILNVKPESYAELCSIVYIQYAESLGHVKIKYWGDKNNYYIDHLHLINKLYPKVRFISIVRDGRDVACSYKELSKVKQNYKYKPQLPEKLEEIALQWYKNNNIIIDYFEKHRNAFNIFIRYEDLVLSTQKTLWQICNYLNLEYNKEMLFYYESNIKEPEETLAWKYKTMRKPDPSKIGSYRKKLSEEEIYIFNNIAEPILSKFNYV